MDRTRADHMGMLATVIECPCIPGRAGAQGSAHKGSDSD